MSETDYQKLVELLKEAERIAVRLHEGIAAYLIRNALMDLNRKN